LAVRIALLELDAEVGQDAFAEDVDAMVVGNEGDESVESERLTSPRRVGWRHIESAGFANMGRVSNLSEDLRLSIDGNRNAMLGTFGIAIKDTGVKEANQISASFQNLLVTVERLVVIEKFL